MLYATDGIDQPKDLDKPMVGIANVWCVPQRPALLACAHLADSLPGLASLSRRAGTTATRESLLSFLH